MTATPDRPPLPEPGPALAARNLTVTTHQIPAASARPRRPTISRRRLPGRGDLRSDQTVLYEVLNLDVLRARIRSATERSEGTAGQVEKRRGVRAGKAVVTGARVPVGTVHRYLAASRTVDDIIQSFPVLTAADVDAVRVETVA